jgi:hypothetical protein
VALVTSGNAVAAGAAGGTSSGGDFNIPGSPSGTATAAVNSGAATGGGAVPYKGFAVPSGDAISISGARGAASGGGGVGGKSGNVTANTSLSRAASGGGGYVSASSDAVNAITGTGGAGFALPSQFTVVLAPLTLGGAGLPPLDSTSGATSTKGGGTGGVIGSGVFTSGNSEMLGGSGAVATVGGSGSGSGSGAVKYGGASGGAVNVSLAGASSSSVSSGDGGAAFAIIETL